jgi:hypothetical protein
VILCSRGLYAQVSGGLNCFNNILARVYVLGGLHAQATGGLISFKIIYVRFYVVGGFTPKQQQD